MRLKSCLGLAATACLLFLTGGPTSLAEGDRAVQYAQFFGYEQPEPQAPQARSRRYPERASEYRRPRRERASRPQEQAPAPQADYNPFAALFGAFSAPPAPSQPSYSAPRASPRHAPRYAPRYEPRFEEPRRRVVRPRPAPVREAARPKAPNVTTSIVVFGDSLADLVGQGLDDAFDEARQVSVVRRTRADSGLVQTEAYDWQKAIRDYLASPQKVTVAVLMVGLNDHEPIKEGETTHEFLSDRWRQLYRERVDGVLKPFAEKNIPVVFVGAPPMKNEKLSTEQIAINEIALERVQRAGAVYVDIWPAFVDDQNRYAQMGPNLAGQVARLRLDDGVGFTKAGARKAAHFAEIEIRRLIESPRTPAISAKPEEPAVAVAPEPNAAPQTNVATLPAPEVAVAPVKPAIGPVLPLTRVEVSSGGALASGRPRLNGANGSVIEKAFGEGAPAAPQPGRADDFRWPRS